LGNLNEAKTIQLWTVKRKIEFALTLFKDETSLAGTARKHGLTVAEVERWRDRFFLGAENVQGDLSGFKIATQWQLDRGRIDARINEKINAPSKQETEGQHV
jgi:hypothetical protein